jgi:Ca-activated chloride channel family protein
MWTELFGLTWDAPGWLWLLPALAAVAGLWRRLGGPGEPAALAAGSAGPRRYVHPLAHLLPRDGGGDAGRRRGVTTWGALGLLVVALAQPVRVGERLPEPPSQRDIVFIVDTSVGMLLRDYTLGGARITRMDLVKRLLDELVQGLEGDRIGVVVFGETAHTLVPLSTDRELVRQMLSRVEVGVAGRFNAVGSAVALAVKQAGRTVGGERRILVLLTDARQSSGPIAPLAAAQLAADDGLPLYTVAIGAASAAAAEEGGRGLIYQPADPALLRAMAERTGARAYQAGGGDALAEAIRDITARPAATDDRPPRHRRSALYHWPLFAALALLALGAMAPGRSSA